MNNKYIGLNDNEVLNNQKLYGKNTLTNNNKNSYIKLIIPIILSLIICVILYLILNKTIYAVIMIFISILILIIQIYKRIKLSKIIENLNKFKNNICKVIRNNKELIINSEDITINDIILLKEGDKVCADAIILESNNLYVDESNLIKDRNSILKSYDLLDKDAQLKSNYIYKESLIINGSVIAKVVNIGNKTWFAKNKSDIPNNENEFNLQKRINNLYRIFTIISIIIFAIIIIVSIFINDNVIYGLISGITISIATLPLITPLTYLLLIYNNIYTLTKNNVIIKNISSLDIISKIKCLCVDKFGIITENKIVVKELYSSLDKNDALVHCALACDKNTNDLFENAINEYVKNNNIIINDEYKLVEKYPFNNKTKMMANVYEYNGELYIFVKGTLNSLFDICDLDVEEKYKLHNFQKQLFQQGLEVMAFGSNKIKKIEKDIFKYNISFDGIISLYNYPKANTKEATEICKQLDIKLVVLSEDKKEIAAHIGKEIGINSSTILKGKEIENMSDSELLDKLKNVNIFSRINSDHKLRILKTLKHNYDIVAITGNKVNDRFILNDADIGISMNKFGTDVSKNFSDIIILDDNFSTIVNTIKEVRKVYDKFKKTINYVLITNILLTLLSIFLVIFNHNILLPLYIIIIKLLLELVIGVILTKN
ncbi:MAG: HAD family hydrolase [Firmicutes bacterium]|nr:HAD family hydrolase [Bacillota bacterium]